MRRSPVAVLPLFLWLSGTAFAQDFGKDWLDRVSHELVEDAEELIPRPFSLELYGGQLYYYDSNVFLEEDHVNQDSVMVGYLGARLQYAEPHFEAVIDAMSDYKYYSREEDARDDEERVFARIRSLGSWLELEMIEVFRRESDPVDVTFAERAERIISETIPRAEVKFTPVLSLEASLNLGWVDFEDRRLGGLDNLNYRANITGIYEFPIEIEGLVNLGLIGIQYRDHDAPPDAQGFFFRVGARGDVTPRILVNALVGYASIESEDYSGTSDNSEHSTADVALHVQAEATETMKVMADYERRFGFAAGEPFQTVNRFTAHFNWEFDEWTTFKNRVQFDFVDTAQGNERDFVSISTSVAWRINTYLSVDGGLTMRMGDTDVGGTSGDFENYIVHFGLLGTY